jgi:hypothetical protein
MNEALTWHHFLYLIGLIAAWSLVIIATARWAIGAGLKGMEKRLTGQEEKIAKVGEKQHQLELDVSNLKADLPLCYVRREDFIREEVTINTKLDRLRDMIATANKNEERGHDTGS